jgi:hypothetical protein
MTFSDVKRSPFLKYENTLESQALIVLKRRIRIVSIAFPLGLFFNTITPRGCYGSRYVIHCLLNREQYLSYYTERKSAAS